MLTEIQDGTYAQELDRGGPQGPAVVQRDARARAAPPDRRGRREAAGADAVPEAGEARSACACARTEVDPPSLTGIALSEAGTGRMYDDLAGLNPAGSPDCHGSETARNPAGDRRERLLYRGGRPPARLPVGHQPADSAARGRVQGAAVHPVRAPHPDHADRRDAAAAEPPGVRRHPRHLREHPRHEEDADRHAAARRRHDGVPVRLSDPAQGVPPAPPGRRHQGPHRRHAAARAQAALRARRISG